MSGLVSNQGLTTAQINHQLLVSLKNCNETLINIEKVAHDCERAKLECATAQQAKKEELRQLTDSIGKIQAVLNKLIHSPQETG